MAVAALVLFAVWAAVALGWRSVVQRRRTGNAGFRGGAQVRRGTVQWWARLLFGLALVAAAIGPVAELAGLGPVGVLDRPAVRVAGVVLAVAGLVATVAAQRSMGESWRIGVDQDEHTTLVTGGVFGVVRNPIFTAMIVTAAGLAFMVPNPITLAGLVMLVTAIQLQVRVVEEPYLARLHGQDYQRYAAAVGRFVPGIGRLGPPRVAADR